MNLYLDTSAALKLLVEEPESAATARFLDDTRDAGTIVYSSMLLMTELHCAAHRRGIIASQGVTAVLDTLALVDVERADLVRAATSRWGLRSADAIHLATALRIDSEAMLVYDHELAEACRTVGIEVVDPVDEPDPAR